MAAAARGNPMFELTAPFAIEPGLEGVVGAQVGRYTIRNIVAFGGMGLVVAAHDAELGRLVAIKLVASDDSQARRRLVREAQAMAQLSHPNVVTVHEVIWFGERAGIVMELVDGDNLATWREARPRSWREIVAAYTQAARGLAAAHRAGLVHRDFKPSNALIDRDGVVRVTDFGLVRAARASTAEPFDGVIRDRATGEAGQQAIDEATGDGGGAGRGRRQPGRPPRHPDPDRGHDGHARLHGARAARRRRR